MSDILQRLRDEDYHCHKDAADEIERLTKELDNAKAALTDVSEEDDPSLLACMYADWWYTAQAEIEQLTKERDNKAQEFEHLKTHFDKMKVMRDESDERVQRLTEALTRLEAVAEYLDNHFPEEIDEAKAATGFNPMDPDEVASVREALKTEPKP